MKTIKFKFTQSKDHYGVVTRCTLIQIRKDGKWNGFSPHTPELIEMINDIEFIVPDGKLPQKKQVDTAQETLC